LGEKGRSDEGEAEGWREGKCEKRGGRGRGGSDKEKRVRGGERRRRRGGGVGSEERRGRRNGGRKGSGEEEWDPKNTLVTFTVSIRGMEGRRRLG